MPTSKSLSFIAGVIATLVIGGGTAVASNGVALTIGHSNVSTRTTTLTDTHGAPLALKAKKGKPALSVNTNAKINNLNADLLDGKHASAFLPTSGTAADSQLLGGHPASGFVASDGTAANSAELGGQPASAYLNDIYSAQTSDEWRTATSPTFDAQKFDTITVPAGTYQLNFNGTVFNNENDPGDFGCRFAFLRAGSPGDAGSMGYAEVGIKDYATVAATELVTFPQPVQLSMICFVNSGDAIQAAYVSGSLLTATPVKGLHGPTNSH